MEKVVLKEWIVPWFLKIASDNAGVDFLFLTKAEDVLIWGATELGGEALASALLGRSCVGWVLSGVSWSQSTNGTIWDGLEVRGMKK